MSGDSVRNESDHVYERRSDERPSEAVIAAVAEATDQSPLEMARFAEAIDPDALDALLDVADRKASSTTVAFDYCGGRVTVTPGEIRIDL